MKIIFSLLFYTLLFALDSCKTCHQNSTHINSSLLSDIHFETKMLSEIDEFIKYKDISTCQVCHGGNSKTFDIKKAHIGAPKKHPGGLKVFVKNPETDEKASQKICGMCHNLGSL